MVSLKETTLLSGLQTFTLNTAHAFDWTSYNVQLLTGRDFEFGVNE